MVQQNENLVKSEPKNINRVGDPKINIVTMGGVCRNVDGDH